MYVNLPSYTSRACFGAVQVGPRVIPDTDPDNVQGISFRPVRSISDIGGCSAPVINVSHDIRLGMGRHGNNNDQRC